MSDETSVIYDPLDEQLRQLEGISASGFTPAELAKPVVVAMLIDQQRAFVLQIKALQRETESLRAENTLLRESREKVREAVARLEVRADISWAQVVISIITGYGGNVLATNWQDIKGWVMLLGGLVALIVLHRKQQGEGRGG